MEWPEEPSVAYALHWLFRRQKLCSGPRKCDYALAENGGTEQCESCASRRLDEWLGDTASGRRLQLVMYLDTLRHSGMTLTLEDLTYPESLMLCKLTMARQQWEEESIRNAAAQRT